MNYKSLNLEVNVCRNCCRNYYKRKHSLKTGRRINLDIRGSNTITCSSRCSRQWNNSQKRALIGLGVLKVSG